MKETIEAVHRLKQTRETIEQTLGMSIKELKNSDDHHNYYSRLPLKQQNNLMLILQRNEPSDKTNLQENISLILNEFENRITEKDLSRDDYISFLREHRFKNDYNELPHLTQKQQILFMYLDTLAEDNDATFLIAEKALNLMNTIIPALDNENINNAKTTVINKVALEEVSAIESMIKEHERINQENETFIENINSFIKDLDNLRVSQLSEDDIDSHITTINNNIKTIEERIKKMETPDEAQPSQQAHNKRPKRNGFGI